MFFLITPPIELFGHHDVSFIWHKKGEAFREHLPHCQTWWKPNHFRYTWPWAPVDISARLRNKTGKLVKKELADRNIYMLQRPESPWRELKIRVMARRASDL
ncbi:hypothetical protein GOODEAATRI_024321 [Goodea atripinnis]|uniref:Uncharacterized protein n=1 Tax=Goodea atripinnis TaxID=208336 RepID=A0ABV0PGP3_9TELE